MIVYHISNKLIDFPNLSKIQKPSVDHHTKATLGLCCTPDADKVHTATGSYVYRVKISEKALVMNLSLRELSNMYYVKRMTNEQIRAKFPNADAFILGPEDVIIVKLDNITFTKIN